MILIDDLIKSEPQNTQKDYSWFFKTDYWGRPGWFICKPVGYGNFFSRLKDALVVLKGKAFAVQYIEDRLG